MSRKKYVFTGIIGAIFCAILYWSVVAWALNDTGCSSSDLAAYYKSITIFSSRDSQFASLGHFLVGIIGIVFVFLGGWGCANIVQWVMDDPNA